MRFFKTPEQEQMFWDAIRAGASLANACAVAGISEEAVRRTIRAGRKLARESDEGAIDLRSYDRQCYTFFVRYQQERGRAALEFIRAQREKALSGDRGAIEWFLENVYGKEFEYHRKIDSALLQAPQVTNIVIMPPEQVQHTGDVVEIEIQKPIGLLEEELGIDDEDDRDTRIGSHSETSPGAVEGSSE